MSEDHDPATAIGGVPRTLLPGATLLFGFVRLPPGSDVDPQAPGTAEMDVDLEADSSAAPPTPAARR